MAYPDFKTDFVKRTIKIWEELSNKTEYEVTLLINCLFGLIVIPTEHNKIFTDKEKPNEYKKYFIEQLKKYASFWPEKPDDNRLVNCMKNALSHLNIDTEPDPENGKIKYVKFKDRDFYNNETEFHTEIKFPVDSLKIFARNIADYFLENCIHK